MSGFAEALMGDPGMATTQGQPDPAQLMEIEAQMASQIQEQAPEVAQEIIAAMSEDGIDQAEVDELRSLVFGALQDEGVWPTLVQYLIQNEMVEQGELNQYDPEYLMILVGVVGLAQAQVQSAPAPMM